VSPGLSRLGKSTAASHSGDDGQTLGSSEASEVACLPESCRSQLSYFQFAYHQTSSLFAG
jgi:hypothetical protein